MFKDMLHPALANSWAILCTPDLIFVVSHLSKKSQFLCLRNRYLLILLDGLLKSACQNSESFDNFILLNQFEYSLQKHNTLCQLVWSGKHPGDRK